MANAENGFRPILSMCVCVTIDSVQNLTQTLMQTHTQTLCVTCIRGDVDVVAENGHRTHSLRLHLVTIASVIIEKWKRETLTPSVNRHLQPVMLWTNSLCAISHLEIEKLSGQEHKIPTEIFIAQY